MLEGLPSIDITTGLDAQVLVANPGADYKYDADYLGMFANLKVVATPSTGVTHIDTDYCRVHNIDVLCLLDRRELLDQISASAEFTWLLVLATVRKFTTCCAVVENGHWRDVEDDCRGRELQGKRIGIIGLGRIGARIARYATAFDMDVCYFDPYVGGGYKAVPLADIFKCDIVVVCPYLTDRSRGMITYDLLKGCDGTIVINTSRGEVVNEQDVCRAVREKKIRFACDVVCNEQNLDEFWNSELYKLAQSGEILITPHVAGATVESQTKALNAILTALKEEEWI
jgi:D-3-phosphoglycerate dehydrogenase